MGRAKTSFTGAVALAAAFCASLGGSPQEGSHCFPAGTKVATESGLRGIEDVQVGDMVLSRNVSNGLFGYKKVVSTATFEATELVKLVVKEDTVLATPTHLFWVREGETEGKWTPASELKAGMKLFDNRGRALPVTSAAVVQQAKTTYDLKVEEWETFFVGKYGLLVQNAK